MFEKMDGYLLEHPLGKAYTALLRTNPDNANLATF